MVWLPRYDLGMSIMVHDYRKRFLHFILVVCELDFPICFDLCVVVLMNLSLLPLILCLCLGIGF